MEETTMKIRNVTKVFEVKEVCPVCGKVNKALYWCIDHSDNEHYYDRTAMHRIGRPNGYYLCNHCGYFRREFDHSFPVEGITLFSDGRALGRQIRTLSKCKSEAAGLQIFDVAPREVSREDFEYTDIDSMSYPINPNDFDYINEGVSKMTKELEALNPDDLL